MIDDPFLRGYAQALADLARIPNEGPYYTNLKYVARMADVTLETCERGGVDEYDLETLKRTLFRPKGDE